MVSLPEVVLLTCVLLPAATLVVVLALLMALATSPAVATPAVGADTVPLLLTDNVP